MIMTLSNMTVAERIAYLKNIFANFGITIADNSAMHMAISSEFGRGKRSVLNQILHDLQHETDASQICICIGNALVKNFKQQQMLAVGAVMRDRLPNVFKIIDIRQQTSKRTQSLEQLLLHFEAKIEPNHRLQRMLAAARSQLKHNLELQAAGKVAADIGIIFNLQDLHKSGKILQCLTPALLALDQPDMLLEQKINFCVQALSSISRELNKANLSKIAGIIDNVHWLAKVTLPELSDPATIEQALGNLGLCFGTITMQNLRKKFQALGLTEEEVIQVIYVKQASLALPKSDLELLAVTQQNKQYAAACSLIAKLGQEIKNNELERIGLAGLCLISMRQTYCEVKTNNINPANFSESLGLMVSTIGILTNNQTVATVGACIIEGVQAYVGLMAVPGGATIAVPLAVCSVLSKYLIGKKHNTDPTALASDTLLPKIMLQLIQLQQEMRQQFDHLYKLLHEQHLELLNAMDQGFANLANFMQSYNVQTLQAIWHLDSKLDMLYFGLSKEFTDLYLEYIRDPIDEINFFARYEQGDSQKLQKHKMKLSMWMLFKAKHHKVNGRDLIANLEHTAGLASYVALVLDKTTDYDSVLGMVNRYVNLEFAQNLPEELPHIPTWIMAVNTYILLLTDYRDYLDLKEQELQIIADIISVGEKITEFVKQLASDDSLWDQMSKAIEQQLNKAKVEYNKIALDISANYLDDLALLIQQTADNMLLQSMQAKSAPAAEQLEPFEMFDIDITTVWRRYLVSHIPAEFKLAEAQGLGSLQITVTIDPTVNNFVHLRLPYTHNLLPNTGRDVLYRLDIHFKQPQHEQPFKLLTGWFAYDLVSAYKRFEEYYRYKFRPSLRHTRYLWISCNGKRNQVAGNNDTDTDKLVDYIRLADTYKNWWQHVQPVNDPEVMSRLKENTVFYATHKPMLELDQCVQVDTTIIAILQQQLQTQIQQQISIQRTKVAAALQASCVLQQSLGKIDAYNSVFNVFKQIMQSTDRYVALSAKFAEIISDLPKTDNMHRNFNAELNALWDIQPKMPDRVNFTHGLFYQKIQHTLASLQLLANSFRPTIRFNR